MPTFVHNPAWSQISSSSRTLAAVLFVYPAYLIKRGLVLVGAFIPPWLGINHLACRLLLRKRFKFRGQKDDDPKVLFVLIKAT